MRTFLAILDTTVREIVQMDEVLDESRFTVDYDTIVEDFTNSYILNETYRLSDYLIRNNQYFTTSSEFNIDNQISELWQRAVTFEREYITGSVYTILAVLEMNNNTKAADVRVWVKSIWSLYYSEKESLLADTGYISKEDFRGCGDCPHTVPELIAEYDALWV